MHQPEWCATSPNCLLPPQMRPLIENNLWSPMKMNTFCFHRWMSSFHRELKANVACVYWQTWCTHGVLVSSAPPCCRFLQTTCPLMRNPPGVCLLKWLLNMVTAGSHWRNATYGFLWRSVIGCSLKESWGRQHPRSTDYRWNKSTANSIPTCNCLRTR